MDPLLRHRAARDRVRADHAHCPDAEVLAAFVDGELSAKERRAVEAHAADCQRCTDTLALSAAAEDPGLSATISHVVAVDRWRRAYWTVPLATAATVAALWVATSREAVAPTHPQLTASKSSTPEVTVPSAAEQQAPVSSDGRRQANIDARRNGSERAAPGGQDAGSPSVRRPAAPERTDTTAAPQLSRVRPAPPAAAPVPEERAESAEAIAPAQSRREARGAATASVRFAAPDARTLWRTTGLAIERSTDAGVTWTEEFRAPRAVLSGAAVSPDVAWFVGEQGLVLRRTAAGWAVVGAPGAEPVVAVRSTGPDAASVTLASGRTVQTTDGGQTWR